MKRLEMTNKQIRGQWFNKLYFSKLPVSEMLFDSMRSLSQTSFSDLTPSLIAFIVMMDFEPWLYKAKMRQL